MLIRGGDKLGKLRVDHGQQLPVRVAVPDGKNDRALGKELVESLDLGVDGACLHMQSEVRLRRTPCSQSNRIRRGPHRRRLRRAW